jgi:hypothetical protein
MAVVLTSLSKQLAFLRRSERPSKKSRIQAGSFISGTPSKR